MNATIRHLKGLLALGALALTGLVLRWITADAVASANTQDLPSMAFLTVGVVAWVAYGWLLLAALATVLEQAPGAIGRSASAIAAGITSHGSQALLRSALGAAAVTPLTIGLAHAAPTQSPAATSTPTGTSTPIAAPTPTPRSGAYASPSGPRATTGMALPAYVSSSNSGAAADGELSEVGWRRVEPASTVRLTGASGGGARGQANGDVTGVRNRPAVASGAEVGGEDSLRLVVPDRPMAGAATRYTELRSGRSRVVGVGESLWSIAAAELGQGATDAAVEARWAQWYSANRQQIGADPHLIRPGQVLRIPAAGHPVPPSHQEKVK